MSKRNHCEKVWAESEIVASRAQTAEFFLQACVTHTARRHVRTKKARDKDFGVSLCGFDGGVYVTDVYKGSSAWAVGLRVGDRIETVNGMEISDSASVATVMETMRVARLLTFAVAEAPHLDMFLITRRDSVRYIDREVATVGLADCLEIVDGRFKATGEDGYVFTEMIVCVNGQWVLGRKDKYIAKVASKAIAKCGAASLLCLPTAFVHIVRECVQRRPRKLRLGRNENLVYA